MESNISGVGVVDKSLGLVALVAERPRTLSELVEASGSSRATTHRLAVALEAHGLLRRGVEGRFTLGLHLIALGRAATEQFPLAEAAGPALAELRERTGESVQVYVRDGENRVCLTALESPHGLRTIVPVGAVLPMDRGSAGRVLSEEVEPGSWSHTAGEREAGVASVSAPVRGRDGQVVAAVSVSGPIDRMGKRPGAKHGEAVLAAAAAIEEALAGS
ncbi:MAG TPA: IclR family transcriptional regulator [Microthrixaceae bacterium]|nr:IclR family transcriptional regulator [Microthrixaceae bacterium]